MSNPSPLQYATAGYDFAVIANAPPASTSQIISDIRLYENTDFKQSFLPSLDTSFGAVNTGKLIGRNNSIATLTEQQIAVNNSTRNAFTEAKDTYTRQGEINEWQAQNKLDTLFFLQILFLFFVIIIALLYLRQAMILGNTAVYWTIGFLLVVVIGVLWNRVSYTNLNRDSRYWNRRYISTNTATTANQCSN